MDPSLPRKAAILAGGIAAWVAAVELLAGDAAGFARTPQGFLFLVGAAAETLVEALGLRVTAETLRDPDPGGPLVVLGFAGPAYALWAWPPTTAWAPALAAAGVVLFLAGLGLRAWSQQTLGDRFTAHVEARGDRGLVLEGPYRHVRHPSYLALLLIFPSGPLVLSSLSGAVVGILGALPFLVVRIRVEERALREAHGEEYEAYAARTPALLPRLRR